MKSINSTLAIAGLTAALLVTQIGCAESGQEPVTENPALASPVPGGMVRGTVLETMNSGGYTYVFIETDQGERWVAGRETAVQVGDVVQSNQGMAMSAFHSKSLNRTFDVVYFASKLENLSSAALPDGHPATALPPGHPGASSPNNSGDEPIADAKVVELKPGQNIAWVYANKDSLDGTKISVRGKVVKYNPRIMGRNFIHVRDGSGDPAEGTNDLTVTSKTETAVGETIVVTGTIILDKDFDAGYSFPILIEGASITTE